MGGGTGTPDAILARSQSRSSLGGEHIHISTTRVLNQCLCAFGFEFGEKVSKRAFEMATEEQHKFMMKIVCVWFCCDVVVAVRGLGMCREAHASGCDARDCVKGARPFERARCAKDVFFVRTKSMCCVVWCCRSTIAAGCVCVCGFVCGYARASDLSP